MKQTFSVTPIRAAVLLALATPTVFAAVGDPVGSAIAVNTTTTGSQTASSADGDVAMDANGNFVAVWNDKSGNDGDATGVYARRSDAAGVGQGDDFLVNTTITTGYQINPRVALDADGDFVVVYGDSTDYLNGPYDYGNVYARRYTAAGVAVAEPFVINSHTDGDQNCPDVAMVADGSFIAVWVGIDDNDPNYSDGNDIFARRFDVDGNPLGSDFRVNTVTANVQDSPRIAADAKGNFVVVWRDDAANNSDGDGAAIMARRFSADGTPVDAAEFVVNATVTGNQSNPEVAMDADGNFVVAWRGDTAVYVRPFGSDGTAKSEIPYASAWITGLGGVAMDADGDFAVTWGEFVYGDPFPAQDYMQRYDRTGAKVNTAQLVVSAGTGNVGSSGAVAMDADGDTVALYADGTTDSDVFAQLYQGGDTGAAGDKQADLLLTVADDTGGTSIRPGIPLTYTFTVTNQDTTGAAYPGIALGITLTDTLPAGMSYSRFASADAWNCSDSSGTVTLPLLDPGASSTFTMTVDASGVSVVSITNDFTVSNGVTDYNATDNTASQISYFDTSGSNSVPVFTGTPVISGTAKVGNTLTVTDTGTTDADVGDTVTLGYQWLRDYVAISGATGASYTVQSADVGKAISVTVTADDGYGDGGNKVTTAAVTASAASSSGGSSSGGGGAFGWLSLLGGLLLFRRRV